LKMAEFPTFVTLTMTFDRVILHTVMHHSSTSTYIPNFIEIEETLWLDGRADGHLRPTLLGRLGGVDLKSKKTKITKNLRRRHGACLELNEPVRLDVEEEVLILRSGIFRSVRSWHT